MNKYSVTLRGLLFTLLLANFLTLTSCIPLAVVANTMPKIVKAKYTGLKGQSCAVMVWADRGTRVDFPNLQLDTAAVIQSILSSKDVADKDEIKGASWPWEARSVVRFQKEHPDIEADAITTTAPRIGVSRLIYIEVESFTTRGEDAVQLLRGTMVGNLKVVEVANGTAKVVYEENNIRAVFPKKSPEGALGVPEEVVYRGTVQGFASQVAFRFYEHEEEDEK